VPVATAEAILRARERLVRAGDSLRARPREQTLESLGAVLDAWSAPGSVWQRRLVEQLPALTGFSAPNVEQGLARALAGWNGDALREWVGREIGELTAPRGFDRTHVLLAGSIPMPTILSLLAPLVLHSPVLAKTASRDPLTAHVFRESLAERDPELAAALEVVSFPSEDPECRAAFLDTSCVVATGSDETVAEIAKAVAPATRLVTYGHRLSIAVLGPSALAQPALPEIARGLALDVALWDQLGCLSPVAVYCQGAAPNASAEGLAETLADALAAALDEIEARLPRGELPLAAAAAARAERDGAEMRRAAGADVSIRSDEALRFSVVREADAEWRPSPLHRFVRVHPVRDRDELPAALAPVARHLAAVALAGFDDEQAGLAADLERIGASRICRPGELQTPPIGWHHDAEPLLPPLVEG
jgi:hypothetical protein